MTSEQQSDMVGRIDDVLVDWNGSVDSAAWAADGSHEHDTGGRSYYHDDVPPPQRALSYAQQVDEAMTAYRLLTGRHPQVMRDLAAGINRAAAVVVASASAIRQAIIEAPWAPFIARMAETDRQLRAMTDVQVGDMVTIDTRAVGGSRYTRRVAAVDPAQPPGLTRLTLVEVSAREQAMHARQSRGSGPAAPRMDGRRTR